MKLHKKVEIRIESLLCWKFLNCVELGLLYNYVLRLLKCEQNFTDTPTIIRVQFLTFLIFIRILQHSIATRKLKQNVLS